MLGWNKRLCHIDHRCCQSPATTYHDWAQAESRAAFEEISFRMVGEPTPHFQFWRWKSTVSYIRSSSTCKSRKLKCDEARPSCARCLKAGRSCEYQDTAPFKIVQPSSSPQRGSLPKTHKNTPSASNIDLVWVNDVDTAGHTEAAPPSPEEDPAPAVGSTVSPPAASSATLKSNLAPVENVYGGEVERLMSLRLTRHFKESPAQWYGINN